MNKVYFPNQTFTLENKGTLKTGVLAKGEWSKRDNVEIRVNNSPLIVTVWGDPVAFIESTQIGSKILGTITISQREYQGKYYTDILIDNLALDTSEPVNNGVIDAKDAGSFNPEESLSPDADDLPF